MSDFSNKLQLLKEIKVFPISMGIKADILKDIARTFPETSEIRKRLDTFNPTDPEAARTLLELIKVMTLLLPLYSPPSPDDQQERQKDIETEVRLSLNEKFTKSPYFLGMSAVLAACITLFSFGLFSLNHDVKSASELVNTMQQQVTSSAAAMNTLAANQQAAMAKSQQDQQEAMARSQKDFDADIQKTRKEIDDAAGKVAATIDAKFKQELEEVRGTKRDTLAAIKTEGDQAKTNIQDAQGAIVRQLNKDTDNRIAALDTAKTENLTRINQRGRVLYYNLDKPSWKDLLLVGFKIDWPLWIASLLGLVLAIVALIRS